MGAEMLQDCPCCENQYLAVRTDIYKDGRDFVYCDVCGCLADKRVWNRIASPSAPEAQGKPVAWMSSGSPVGFRTAEQRAKADPIYACLFDIPLYAAPSPSPVLVEEALRKENEQLRKALEDLMDIERRGRLMPIGREWDAARAALSSHGDKGGSK